MVFKNRQEELVEVENKEMMKTTESKDEEIKSQIIDEKIWQVEIPVIELTAPISEGTSQEVMQEFVGHFEETSKEDGNIGLAAHNRGYPINYFARLKELNKGDKVVYKYGSYIKTYSVELITVIEDTNWSYLQETKENILTLITCVESTPNKRLCIQAIEIKEE